MSLSILVYSTGGLQCPQVLAIKGCSSTPEYTDKSQSPATLP